MSNIFLFQGARKSFSLLLSVFFIFSLINPAIAGPFFSSNLVVNLAEVSAGDVLSPAYVSAQDLNQIFDLDGVILAHDTEDEFLLENTTGEGLLHTRLYPMGETGTLGNGLYGYLYRIDLSNLVSSIETLPCVTQFNLQFGIVSPLDYDGNDLPEDYFVIDQGGAIGDKGPSQIGFDPTSGKITVSFSDEICAGYGTSTGESSFFFGFASTQPYKTDQSNVILTGGSQYQVETRVPGGSDCSVIMDPSEIPSPATINFDTLSDETPILNSYQSSYGVTFGNGVKADSITTPITARSTPNIATTPYIPLADPTLNFTFDSAVSHVGFYAGNPTETALTATIKGYMVSGGLPDIEICTTSVQIPVGQMDTFLGFYDPQNRINKVIVEYPINVGEIIDDLVFAPDNGGDRLEFPRAMTPLSGAGPKITINFSDNTRFAANFSLPDAALWMEEHEGIDKPRLRFGLPGSEINSNQDGYPDVPVIRRLIAIPEGSTPILDNIAVIASQEFDTDLYPSQPSPVDVLEEFANPPYTIDTEIYSTNVNFPLQQAYVYPVGKMRDLNLAMLVVAGGQYNPVSRKLVIFKEINLEVLFEGGQGVFLPDYSNNPFEPALLKNYGDVLNSAVIGDYLGEIPGYSYIGNEFLIFTHHNFLAAAERLASWKTSKGIATKVIDTKDETINNADEIYYYIKDLYDNSAVRPSYVLLFGDSEYVESFFHDTDISYAPGTYSDLDYSLMTEGDTFPDLAYGRIPVDTLEQANIVVDKIIAYEQDPPDTSSFYDTITLASFFQCCKAVENEMVWDYRSFIESSEAARTALVAAGKTVNRIYTTDVITPNIPAYYYNGAVLPSSIGANSNFTWPGSTNDIVDAFNNGTSLILHRDHGNWTGWGDPDFSIFDVDSLNNNNLTPVIYSINCSSGVWDNEIWPTAPMDPPMEKTDTSWIEMMLRVEDGAVSLIGDTRNSPTWPNSALTRGLFDATWPATDPNYGDNTIHYRLGDILNYAKLYLYSQVSIPQTAGEIPNDKYEYENLIYHVIGDPTLELWRSMPIRELVNSVVYHWSVFPPGNLTPLKALPSLIVDYPIEGAIITLLQYGLPVGRGTVESGHAVIQFVTEFNPNAPLQVSACQDDDVCVELTPPKFFGYLPLITR